MQLKKGICLLLCVMLLGVLVPMQALASEEAVSNPVAGTYYENAVLWASENAVLTDAESFAADAACTRAQVLTYLWRAYGAPQPVAADNPFRDVDAADDSGQAILWAVENNIAQGDSESVFGADVICTRAQAMQYIYANVQANGGGFVGTWMFRLPFTDVSGDAYEAVAWCYKEHITHGTSATTFSPDMDCTHAHMVSFLHNALGE